MACTMAACSTSYSTPSVVARSGSTRRNAHAAHRPQMQHQSGSDAAQKRSDRSSARAVVPAAVAGGSSAATAAEAKPDPFAEKKQYWDGPFSRLMIWYFSQVMSNQLGGKPFDGTWNGFVALSREIMRGRNTQEQQEVVAGVLAGLLPPQAPERFRRWFPPNKRNSEFNALLTTLGFTWLVGPSKIKEIEVEYEGRKEQWMSGVQIEKCRYLESSGCVGMCVNMCKLPTQRFFTETFGLPLTMEPNFEDLSCTMRFGVPPPPVEQDPVYNQPCFATQCSLLQGAGATAPRSREAPCPKIDSERRQQG